MCKMRNRVFGFCLIVLACLSFDRASFAQHRVRHVDTGIVVLGCFTDAIKPISNIPPLRSDMPLDCKLGYIYFDSLCRNLGEWPRSYDRLDSMLAAMNSFDKLHTL